MWVFCDSSFLGGLYHAQTIIFRYSPLVSTVVGTRTEWQGGRVPVVDFCLVGFALVTQGQASDSSNASDNLEAAGD